MTITRGTTPTLTVRLRHTKTRELIDLERLRLGEAWVSFGKPGSTVLTFSAGQTVVLLPVGGTYVVAFPI